MNREAMEKWVAALEDPANEARQIQGEYFGESGGVCALGLGWETFNVRSNRDLVNKFTDGQDVGRVDYSMQSLTVKLDGRLMCVSYLNDVGWSFWDIAQALRATHLKETT